MADNKQLAPLDKIMRAYGIGSISLGIALIMIVYGMIFYMAVQSHGYNNVLHIIGWFGRIINLIGLCLGIVGLFQKKRMKLMAILGIVLNLLIIMSVNMIIASVIPAVMKPFERPLF